MKKQVVKLLIIFSLILSILRTGSIGELFNNILKFFFGGATIILSLLTIFLLILSFINFEEDKRKIIRKHLISLSIFLTSFFLIVTLIKLSNLFDTDVLLTQTNFTLDNINDGIGIVQAFIVVLLHNLIGSVGVYVISISAILVSIYLSVDIEKIKVKIQEIRKDKEQDEDEFLYEEEKESFFNKIKKNLKKETPKKEVINSYEEKGEEETYLNFDKEINLNDDLDGLFELKTPITGNSKLNEKGYIIPDKEVIQEEVNLEFEEEVKDFDKAEIPIEEKNVKSVNTISNKNKKYTLPPLTLLNDISSNTAKYKELRKSAEDKIENLMDALDSFNIKAKVENIVVGATITRYELSIEKGQKVSRFKNLSDDLSMALAASSIRIEAPIPGKSLVGIEIPNDEKVMVGLKEVLKSKNNSKKDKIQVALGKNITGEDSFIDIAKTPHLLVAGATGSGKSVCINSIITSILLKAKPEEVKFLLVDPKKVELTPYEGIPHLIAPVVTDVEKATVALNKLVEEMEKRYELFTDTRTRNIEAYNNSVSKDQQMPLIVAIIDELADLMMVASNDVEISIARIAQKARAAGIHLILATQRPSTDVITGLIKANIPSRISFMVSSAIDSRTILSKNGAEKLLGHGDMLLSMGGSPNTERIQGGYLSDEEISNVVDYIRNQFSEEEIKDLYKEDFVKLESEQISTFASDEEDPLTEQALEIGINENRISASLLQRRLKIGYNRASRIIEDLEAQGKVSKPEGNKGRKILVEGLVDEEDFQ